MYYNPIFLPPYSPIRKNNLILPNNTQIKENTEKKQKEIPEISETPNHPKNKRKEIPFEKIFSFLDLEFDDLLILGILFFLYLEKCNDLLLYGALFLLLFDIELDSLFKFF